MTEPNLQFPAVFFFFLLRKPSVCCENLRCSAVSCALHMLEISRTRVESAKIYRFLRKICVLASLYHLSSVPLSVPRFWALTVLSEKFESGQASPNQEPLPRLKPLVVRPLISLGL